MRKIYFPLILIAIIMTDCSQEPKAGTGKVEFIDNELSHLISKEAKVEIIAEGFEWSEGPVWLEKQQMLIFSDVPTNIIYK
jgi:gluconolactonase